MRKGGKRGTFEEAGEDQGLGGWKGRETIGALEEGGGDQGLGGWEREGNREHWRKEERRGEKGALEHGGEDQGLGGGLGDGEERGEGSTGAWRRGEKGALEHRGVDQELEGWEKERSREHWSTEERREGSTGA